jgi:hypothetical protein
MKNHSFSQTGEDSIINQILMDSGKLQMEDVKFGLGKSRSFKTKLRYIDIGSGHPRVGSNTFRFYKLGWSGITIEANPSLVKLSKILRPRDRAINVAVGLPGTGQFYQFYSHVYSTLDSKRAERMIGLGLKAKSIKEIKTMDVRDILASYDLDFIELLSVDIEGMDELVIKTFPFDRCRPFLICVEELENSSVHKSSVAKFLETKDYSIIAFTTLSTIFIDATKRR